MSRAFSLLWPCLVGALALFPAACSSNVAPPSMPTPKSIVPSATTISFTSNTAQTFSVSEAGYDGSFSAQSSDTSVATVTRAVTAATSSTQHNTFTVTPVGGGTTTIVVSDTIGDSITIAVTVTGATVTPQLSY